MTTQEAYERIREFFSREGAQLARLHRRGGGMFCVYRGGGDPASPLRCAVGCLVPDDEYREAFEDKNVGSIYASVPALAGIDEAFLKRAQEAHDGAGTVGEFLDELDELASCHGLKVAAA